MADSFVQLPDDSGNTGKKVRTQTRTVGADSVHEHYFILQDEVSDTQGVLLTTTPGAAEVGLVVRNVPTGTQAVSAASLPLPSGASTETTLALIKAKTDNLDVLLSTRTEPTIAQIVKGDFPGETTLATKAGQTQPGVDIGDVTINNAGAGAAVNIQDGGNVITVDGTVTTTPPANASTNVAQVAGTNTVTGGVNGLLAVGGNVANAGAATANPVPVGGIFTTTPATLTTGQTATLQFTNAQNAKNDITTIAGTAPTVAGKLDVKAIDGDVFVRQATAANLNAAIVGIGTAGAPTGNILTVQGVAAMTKLLVTPDSVALPANQSVNVAQMGGIATSMNTGVRDTGTQRVTVATNDLVPGNITQMNSVAVTMNNGIAGTGVQRVAIASDNTAVSGMGVGATGAAVPANAGLSGGRAATSNPANASNANLTGVMVDKAGRLVMTRGHVRELIGVQQATVAATSETTIVTAGGAGVFNDISQLIITTAGAAAQTITIKDATAGTTRMILNYPNAAVAPGAPMIINFDPPLVQAAANANWTVTQSAATGCNYTTVFLKNL